MTCTEADIAIIGGGCIGASILHELAARGFRNVVLIDQGRKTVSASIHSGGMLRVFHENIEHIELALANHQLLARYRNQGLLRPENSPNGSLYFFDRLRLPSYQAGLARISEEHYPLELLTAKEGEDRFPGFHWKRDEVAIYEPQGTRLDPGPFIEDLLTHCRAIGIQILDSFEVQRICPYLDRYRIAGPDGVAVAKSLILAGGARLLPRLLDLGVSFPLEAKSLTTYVAEKSDQDFILPNYFDRETLEFGGLGFGKTVTLSCRSPERTVQNGWKNDFQEKTAQDCYAPHRMGFLGQVPGHPRLYLATGWGGTAFKFALAVGRRAAGLIERDFSSGRLIYA